MGTTSFTNVRRFAGFAITLLFSLCLVGKAVGQDPAPLVTASSANGLDHKTGSTWGAIQQTAIDANGDWLVVDTAIARCMSFRQAGDRRWCLPLPGPSVVAVKSGYRHRPRQQPLSRGQLE